MIAKHDKSGVMNVTKQTDADALRFVATATPGISDVQREAMERIAAQLEYDAKKLQDIMAALQEISGKSRIESSYTSASALALKLASIGSMARDAIAKAQEEQS